MDNRNKRILYVIILSALVFYIYYSLPQKFQSEINGFEYRLDDKNYKNEVSISIEGWYTRKLFSSDSYQGSMIIGDTKLTQLDFYITKDGEVLMGEKEKTLEYESFGTIYSTGKFEEFTICVYEKDENGGGTWNSEDGFMISAPSENREIALALSNKLMKKALDYRTILK